MVKRYVLDGCPGSGKTTLIFGKSDVATDDIHYTCLTDLGYIGMPESAAKAFFELKNEGIDAGADYEKFLERIVTLERDKYLAASQDNIYFCDRSFHHWIHFRKSAGVKLPEWYDKMNSEVRYEEPIFLLQPILSFDMTTPGIGGKTRIFTVSDRIEAYHRSKAIYKDLGYKVLEIPLFSQDPEENNMLRMDRILENIDTYTYKPNFNF